MKSNSHEPSQHSSWKKRDQPLPIDPAHLSGYAPCFPAKVHIWSLTEFFTPGTGKFTQDAKTNLLNNRRPWTPWAGMRGKGRGGEGNTGREEGGLFKRRVHSALLAEESNGWSCLPGQSERALAWVLWHPAHQIYKNCTWTMQGRGQSSYSGTEGGKH